MFLLHGRGILLVFVRMCFVQADTSVNQEIQKLDQQMYKHTNQYLAAKVQAEEDRRAGDDAAQQEEVASENFKAAIAEENRVKQLQAKAFRSTASYGEGSIVLWVSISMILVVALLRLRAINGSCCSTDLAPLKESLIDPSKEQIINGKPRASSEDHGGELSSEPDPESQSIEPQSEPDSADPDKLLDEKLSSGKWYEASSSSTRTVTATVSISCHQSLADSSDIRIVGNVAKLGDKDLRDKDPLPYEDGPWVTTVQIDCPPVATDKPLDTKYVLMKLGAVPETRSS